MKLANLRGYKVLLTFDNAEEALRIIKEFRIQLSDIFCSLERCVPGPNLLSRTVWLRCYGVPLHAWDPKVLEEIGGKLGEIL